VAGKEAHLVLTVFDSGWIFWARAWLVVWIFGQEARRSNA